MNTPDQVEEIAILMPQILTPIQPLIEKFPVPVLQVMVPEVVRETN